MLSSPSLLLLLRCPACPKGAEAHQRVCSWHGELRCPACPKGAEADPDKAAIKTELAGLLGGDEDCLVAILKDFGL